MALMRRACRGLQAILASLPLHFRCTLFKIVPHTVEAHFLKDNVFVLESYNGTGGDTTGGSLVCGGPRAAEKGDIATAAFCGRMAHS